MSKNPILLSILSILVFIPLIFGCDSMHRVGLKVPLKVASSFEEVGNGLDESELTEIKLLMDDYAFKANFFALSTLNSDFDYYNKGYNRQDGPWRYGFYYTIDIKASLLVIHFHQWGPGYSEDPMYEVHKEDLINYLKRNFQGGEVLIDPDNCDGGVFRKIKVKLHDRTSFFGLFQWEENPEYWDLLNVVKGTLNYFRHISSIYENKLGTSYSIGRITGYGPWERQIDVLVSGGGFSRHAKVEIKTTDCTDQYMDEIDIDMLYERLKILLKTEFGEDAIHELEVK